MTSPVAIDLFCGCGGLTLGLKQAGFHVVWAVDSDSLAIETYRVNHPGIIARESDIRLIDPAEVLRRLKVEAGQIDLLAGCPPCQGFSTMRTMNGNREVADEKNDLVFEFLRFVEVLRPRAIMMENVPGLAGDARFTRLTNRLREIGYHAEHRVLNVADYGVPQRRRRLMLLAGAHGPLPFTPPSNNRRTVRETIGGLLAPGSSGDLLHDRQERRSQRIKDLIYSIPADGGGRLSLESERQLACHREFNGFKDVYGRMAWDRPAPTITGGCFNPSKGRFLHPEAHRAITLREAALLQGFPPDYFFSLRRGKALAALLIGNALPPGFVSEHARQVHTELDRLAKLMEGSKEGL